MFYISKIYEYFKKQLIVFFFFYMKLFLIYCILVHLNKIIQTQSTECSEYLYFFKLILVKLNKIQQNCLVN